MHCLRSRDFAATYVYMCRCKWQALWAAHRRARKGGGFDHGRFETVDSAHTPGRNMVDPKSLVAHEDVELPNLLSAHQRIRRTPTVNRTAQHYLHFLTVRAVRISRVIPGSSAWVVAPFIRPIQALQMFTLSSVRRLSLAAILAAKRVKRR